MKPTICPECALGALRSSSRVYQAAAPRLPIRPSQLNPVDGFEGDPPGSPVTAIAEGTEPVTFLRDIMARSSKRRCIVTQQSLPSNYLLRFVPTLKFSPNTPTQTVLTPFSAKVPAPQIPGIRTRESIWVSCRRDAIEALTTGGPHVGALRRYPSMVVPPDIAEQVYEELQKGAIDQLNQLCGRMNAVLPQVRLVGKEERIVTRWTPLNAHQASRQGHTGVIVLLDPNRPGGAGTDHDVEYNVLDSIAPILPLNRLFDDEHLPKIDSALEQLLPTTSFKSNTGAPTSRESSLIAIHQNDSVPGVLALLRALLRLDLWQGRGWVEVEQLGFEGKLRRQWV